MQQKKCTRPKNNLADGLHDAGRIFTDVCIDSNSKGYASNNPKPSKLLTIFFDTYTAQTQKECLNGSLVASLDVCSFLLTIWTKPLGRIFSEPIVCAYDNSRVAKTVLMGPTLAQDVHS